MSLPTSTLAYSLKELTGYEKNLVLKESPIGSIGAQEVLVKVHAVSLQYRDLVVARGSYTAPIAENVVPCSDAACEIIAVGNEVKGWKVGDRVCANFCPDHVYGPTNEDINNSALGGQQHGVLTQYRTFPAHSLVRIPDHLSYEEASTLPCAALTAYNALYGPVPIKAGDFVLVLGTGGVSIFALQFAVAAGATVIATSSSDEKLKIASKLGAKHLINYNKTPNWHEEVKRVTKGIGAKHVIEVGGAGTLFKSVKSAKMGDGQVHLIGFVSSEAAESSLVFPIIGGGCTLRGILIGSVAQFEDMNRLMEANPEVTRPVIDKVFPFDKAVEAYAYIESQKHVGKVVIKVA
ncbi:hypothetical protein D9613_011538 [Agrocybe pediades]|uniref:Enoyl reductase (ER) domain-containing protein n=1 Tax=Agrocybe pediades TaxID=84607 RepID=A0A8H4VS04_9AGAR|nr:hypothetical protein D9613_011538 [Agrocybe pediades]KAF9568260.1 NAD-P-binding protein [Agrocybe pediades]